MSEKSPVLNVIYKNPNDLTPYIKNTKIHSTEQLDKIAGQIAAFGFDQPIVIDKAGVIIKGHGRREAALRLGLTSVPVIVAEHLDEYAAMAARIGDNKVAEAPWDHDLLKFEFGTLLNQGLDLPKITGFDLSEIDLILQGWSSDIDAIDSVRENLDGIIGTIKVKCPQEAKMEVFEFLKQQIAESGFENVEIE